MTGVELLSELHRSGITFRLRGDRIVLRGPKHLLTPELAESLRKRKPEILTVVRRRPSCCECGTAILDPVTTWWGGQPCHRECGDAAFRR